MPGRQQICAKCGEAMPRIKRAPNSYNLFVRQKMTRPEVQALPPRERMKKVAELWRAEKTTQQ